ncbi:MAG: 50S ribosomal protein L32 [Candidatus Omnitrophica bacterium]|nr:50S ribosomal protein L32 [bacterium]NUN94971.1 50S ribosomal protein L32 [Candidatus Omnitrophota bacterium]
MPNPKHRKSKSKTRMGRSHHALKPPSLGKCPNCGEMFLPHRACPACGFYKERQVLDLD